MAGIAGILKQGKEDLVSQMLETLSYRGNYGHKILGLEDATIGMVWSQHESEAAGYYLPKTIFMDGPGFGHYFRVWRPNGSWVMLRDELGVAPAYYCHTKDGDLCFASEAKALLPISDDISELPPGHFLKGMKLEKRYGLAKLRPLKRDAEIIAADMLSLLSVSISRRITSDTFGAMLTGGLGSAMLAVLAKPWVTTLHTFSGGLTGSPILEFARQVATSIGSRHHETLLSLDKIVEVLPEFIYHLETFDISLVRSGVVNYLVAKTASEYVGDVLSGEGGDEFFTGYEYHKGLPEDRLNDMLIHVGRRLHKTSLLQADRCAAAHGITPHVIFADPEVFEFALRIPANLKIKGEVVRWFIHKAFHGILPDSMQASSIADFRDGAGVGKILSAYADSAISDHDFKTHKTLNNGIILGTREEFLYYRIFKEVFGDLENLGWMSRTPDT
jgi:asparagine synthase (glutamine-hydrolysing)